MSDITSAMAEDDELEDLEPEPGDAENVKGGSSQDNDAAPDSKGGSGSK